MSDFLQRAIDLARAVDPHLTSPNPRVGCVVVSDNKIISEGAHLQHGSAHAEVLALSPDLPKSGFEIYITLEPCDHFVGKNTPSCTALIIKLQPKKVIVGALDPKFQGENLEKLRAAGIAVEFVDNKACRDLNPFLEKWHSDSPYPYITLKIAQSLDGKITSSTKYITNQSSREKVHEIRSQYSAVLTSTETIIQDNPLLNCRLTDGSDPAVVIVGTRELDLDQYKVFSVPERDVFELRTQNLHAALKTCKNEGIDAVMIEVGQTLNTEFIKSGLIDEIQIFIAPVLLGETEKSAFVEEIDLKDFRLTNQASLEGDICLRYRR